MTMILNPWRRIRELEEDLSFYYSQLTHYKRLYYRLFFYGSSCPEADGDHLGDVTKPQRETDE